MTSLSTHVLDIERGAPAVGVPIALFQDDQQLAEAETDAGGRIASLADGSSLNAGSYRLVFDLAAYFDRQGRPTPFLQRISIDFQINAGDAHYHVPLLLSQYACTTYRGS
ncbi:MAG: hydroxyisourate hydrolase [Chloroflexi bacterium]|nr:hydroxyisourate hydrolase [Chloroflexota bacterium]